MILTMEKMNGERIPMNTIPHITSHPTSRPPMTPLWQQRAELIEANTDLLLRWLALVDVDTQHAVIRSMVRSYKLPQLKDVHAHLLREVAAAERPEAHGH